MAWLTIEAFERYHADNPQVWDLFERFALQALSAGRRRFGAKIIFERIRWYSSVETIGDKFKVNNNYSSFYARKFEEAHPEFGPVFEKRASVADRKGSNHEAQREEEQAEV